MQDGPARQCRIAGRSYLLDKQHADSIVACELGLRQSLTDRAIAAVVVALRLQPAEPRGVAMAFNFSSVVTRAAIRSRVATQCTGRDARCTTGL